MANVNLKHAYGTETRQGREYTEIYQVLDTSADPNMVMQRQGDGLPGFGDNYPTDGFSHVIAIEPRRYERVNDAGTTKYKWAVEVRYAPRHKEPVPEESNVEPKADPTAENPVVSVGSAVRETVLEKDINGKAVDNSANDPFDPPVLEEEHDDLLSVTVNIADGSFNMATTMAYKDTYNDAAITICKYAIPQYAGLMRDIQCQPLSRNGTNYWAVTYEIQVTRRDGLWQKLEVLDQGYQYLDAADGNKKKDIENDQGQRVSRPQKLDGSGGILASGADPKFEEFETKSSADWSALSLPASPF